MGAQNRLVAPTGERARLRLEEPNMRMKLKSLRGDPLPPAPLPKGSDGKPVIPDFRSAAATAERARMPVRQSRRRSPGKLERFEAAKRWQAAAAARRRLDQQLADLIQAAGADGTGSEDASVIATFTAYERRVQLYEERQQQKADKARQRHDQRVEKAQVSIQQLDRELEQWMGDRKRDHSKKP